MIANRFVAPGVSKSSIVIASELGKIAIAFVSFFGEKEEEKEKVYKSWSLIDSLKVAAVPATLYAIQNLLVQYGYTLLDSMTFNLLNQTKTISAAFWLWLLMGNSQSYVQMLALVLLLSAAIILNLPDGSKVVVGTADFKLGVALVAGASMLSGLSAALTQKALVDFRKRHPFFFSAELAVFGITFLLFNLIFNSDIIEGGSLFSNWSLMTFLPVITNACGGLIVGLVTKYAGGVVKGFALIAGIIITGLAQFIFENKPLGTKSLYGILLVSISIYLHASYPPPKKQITPSGASSMWAEKDEKKEKETGKEKAVKKTD